MQLNSDKMDLMLKGCWFTFQNRDSVSAVVPLSKTFDLNGSTEAALGL